MYFDREDGVKLPILRRGDASDEEDNHDTISFMSLPAVMDHHYQRHSVDETEASTQTPIQEEELTDEEEEEKSVEKTEGSVESAAPLVAKGIKMEVQGDEDEERKKREYSIEEIRVSLFESFKVKDVFKLDF